MADFFKSFPILSAPVFFIAIFIQYFLFLNIVNVDSVQFDVSSFSPDETSSSSIILYQGDAVASVGAIEFNDVAYLCHVGQAIYAKKVPMWDSDSGKVADFSTHFTFIIDTQNRSTYGHGLAFFLAPPGFQIPPNSAGGFLGLFNTTNSASPQNHMVVVEFDSFSNPEWDPSFEHVGINNNSISSSVVGPWNVTLHSGQTTDAWVIYNATTKNLSVFWNYGGGSPNSTLSYIIDLKEILTEWVTVGFSAATGQNVERHVLRSWAFSSSLDKKEEQSHKTTERKIGLGVGLTAAGVLLIAIAGGIGFLILRKRKQISKYFPDTEAATNLTSMNYDLERRAGPRKFSYKDLATATNNFSNERKLGEGGFGEVYKGYLIDLDMAVAVKKISRGSKQGKKEYVTEVKIISSLRHRNLVQLIGWCHDQGEFLLVYEFMPNGSLDAHLFGNAKKNPVPIPILSWALRYKITLGLASALLYLHEEWEQCVIHRDIKSSNIMLDSNFNVKLGDFGLARLMDHELGPQTTGLAGTLGYMAPEYVRTGRASKESDVYSFGVVALEIACGRKSSDVIILTEEDDDSGTGLVECVWNWYGKGQILSVVDQRLGTEFDPQQVECLVMVGLWCAHPDRNLRPSIRQAIQVLNFEAAFPNLPGKFPIPVYEYHHRTISPPGVSSSGEPVISCTSMNDGR